MEKEQDYYYRLGTPNLKSEIKNFLSILDLGFAN